MNQNINALYHAAVESFVDKVRDDPNIIAVFLAGSLAYDTVWEKSDVDISVIIRDQPIATKSYSIDENNIILNVTLYTRSDFVKQLGKLKGGSFLHSYLSKGKFVYTNDESLRSLVDDIRVIGDDDLELSFFAYACYLIGDMEKVEKWLTVKNDPMYAVHHLLKAADNLANMYLILQHQPISREATMLVSRQDPVFMEPFYQRPLSGQMTSGEVKNSLLKMETFLDDHLSLLAHPAVSFLEDGEIKTVTELCNHFNIDSHSITHIFEYLVQKGILDKVSQTIRITPKGRKCVEEVAFMYFKEEE
jgi:predicted transcriptional regulator